MLCSGAEYGDGDLRKAKEQSRKSGSEVSTQAIILSVVGIFILGIVSFLWIRERMLSHKELEAPLTGKLRLNETLTVGNDLKITLKTIRRDMDKYKVSATAFLGGDTIKIINAEVGCEVTYPKEHGYRIALINSEADSATFSIVKVP